MFAYVGGDGNDAGFSFVFIASNITPGDAHQSNDVAIFAKQGHLGGDEPIEFSLLVMPDFRAVDKWFAGAEN